ncbi:UPF0682 family protein [Heterostelium album PN500]|uniref:UPF0682 family protein n=1 Tax=Heterostelium pallidum (strain ATCC 26659 / Pp 5 / PN500) TaxID=670386 RepID=D3B9Y2_HETP5|nr:UPF0682 family protein [Heterostelium album PN500]EFA81369.1 UPF0682 family protein [Heterostelium album PN500]|eukprot:XP_020433487.1 UPF0682 family protein [Heterostelium album PN500]
MDKTTTTTTPAASTTTTSTPASTASTTTTPAAAPTTTTATTSSSSNTTTVNSANTNTSSTTMSSQQQQSSSSSSSSSTSNSSNINGTSSNNTGTSTATSNGNTQQLQQQDAVKTFEHLLRKSQRLFVGLRDLPQFGRQWQPFFQKTFELYTKLWKHQQLYRSILEDKTKYGLKRCEIGEIASKIGQLYYHYYLRTSDTNYLNESYIFYEAIRLRSYFKDVSSDTKMPDMMVKQLRYYARFIVEIFSFLQADQCLSFTDNNNNNQHVQLSHRLSASLQQQLIQLATTSPSSTSSTSSSTSNNNNNNNNNNNTTDSSTSTQILQQAILVGNHQNQIKFSEITLDMFRMTQSLEYETPELKDPSDKQQQPSQDHKLADITSTGTSSSSKKKNPHKYLLYRPTITQLLLFLSNASKELGENKALLLYLSVDGVKNSQESNDSTYANALLMNSQKSMTTTTSPTPQKSSPTSTASSSVNKTDDHNNNSTDKTNNNNNNNNNQHNNCSINTDGVKMEALYPMDLMPFCRKPFFLIIDSQCSNIFKDITPPFNQPFISLLSPLATPKNIAKESVKLSVDSSVGNGQHSQTLMYQVSSNPSIPSNILLHQSVLNSVIQLATALNCSEQFNVNANDIPLQNLSIDNNN